MEILLKKPRRRNRLEPFSAKKMVWLMVILTSILCIGLVFSTYSARQKENLQVYYAFDEQSGSAAGDSVGTINATARGNVVSNKTGILDRAFFFPGGTGDYMNTSDNAAFDFGTGEFTIMGWVNVNASAAGDRFIGAGGSDDGNGNQWFIGRFGAGESIEFGYWDSGAVQEEEAVVSWDVNTWYHWAFVRSNDTTINYYWNGTNVNNFTIPTGTTINSGSTGLILGDRYASSAPAGETMNGTLDEIGIWNRGLNASEVSVLYNSGSGVAYGTSTVGGLAAIDITLLLPIDGADLAALGTNFSANYTTTVSNVSNATYYIWYSNGTVFNNSVFFDLNGTTNTTSRFIDAFTLGNYVWNVWGCYANNTFDNCSWADANFSFEVGANVSAEVYTNVTYETSQESFEANVSLLPGTTLYQSKLFYNGTEYTGSEQSIGTNRYRVHRKIDVPLNTPLLTANNTWYWELTFEKSDGSFVYQNLTFYNQTVNIINFSKCNLPNNVSYINFTTKEAVNPFPNLNSTFKSAWYYWLGNGTVKQNYTFEDTSEGVDNYSFCAQPVFKNFTVNADIEIDATGYAQNYHYLTNATISNSSQTLSLYLLNDSLATLTVLRVQDGAQNRLANVSIQIQLYDVGTGAYYTTAMAKTSFNGEDLAYLNWYDSFYKMILTRDGEVLKIVEPYKITETPQIYEIITDITYPYDKYQDFVYSLIYNNATGNFVLTFTRPSGLTYSGCLRVTKRTFRNDTTICDECSTSTSATISCNINAYGNGTYYATFYGTASPTFGISTIVAIVGGVNELADLIDDIDGAIFAFLFVGIVFVMFLITPVLGVIGLLLGIVGSIVLGFHILNVMALSSIIIMGVLVIWLLGRK